jgi:hypothetical protein
MQEAHSGSNYRLLREAGIRESLLIDSLIVSASLSRLALLKPLALSAFHPLKIGVVLTNHTGVQGAFGI